MGAEETRPYASRAGVKLAAALHAFDLSVEGLVCADFGCHAGGFTDCLLRHGAARVFALDTGYGVLDYRLRTDPRVVVMERTNVLDEIIFRNRANTIFQLRFCTCHGYRIYLSDGS